MRLLDQSFSLPRNKRTKMCEASTTNICIPRSIRRSSYPLIHINIETYEVQHRKWKLNALSNSVFFLTRPKTPRVHWISQPKSLILLFSQNLNQAISTQCPPFSSTIYSHLTEPSKLPSKLYLASSFICC